MASPHVQHYPATLRKPRRQLGPLLVRVAFNLAGFAIGAGGLYLFAAASFALY